MTYFDRKAFWAGLAAAIAVVVVIYFGSGGLTYFDWALATYAAASVFAAFAVAYRYAVWASRPPTRILIRRGLGSFAWLSPRKGMFAGKFFMDNFVLQRFIAGRGASRWIMHACLSWGGILGFALTFPLVFGWIHFETLPHDAETYRTMLFGFEVEQFSVHGLNAFLHFNLLNISAVMMLVGLALSIKLRMSDRGELAIQTFGDDALPVLLLFAVSTTGLMLTASYRFMAGAGFQFIGMAHAASVIGLLLYLPFGKLFHIIQRPLSLGASVYRNAARDGKMAACARCGAAYAALMHIEDLKTTLDQLGFNFRFAAADGREIHYQDICPACRRRLLAVNQGRALSARGRNVRNQNA